MTHQSHLDLQMATYPDPAQALTIVMEVAVETVNNVAQIAMETLQKMSAITIEQLNNAEQQPEEQRYATSCTNICYQANL